MGKSRAKSTLKSFTHSNMARMCRNRFRFIIFTCTKGMRWILTECLNTARMCVYTYKRNLLKTALTWTNMACCHGQRLAPSTFHNSVSWWADVITFWWASGHRDFRLGRIWTIGWTNIKPRGSKYSWITDITDKTDILTLNAYFKAKPVTQVCDLSMFPKSK